MPVLYLTLAILFEVAGTLALRASEGFSRPLPVAVVVVGYTLSFVMLAFALKHIPVSLSYAIWAGAGTALVALASVAVFGESLSAVKVLSIGLIIAGVVGVSASGVAH